MDSSTKIFAQPAPAQLPERAGLHMGGARKLLMPVCKPSQRDWHISCKQIWDSCLSCQSTEGTMNTRLYDLNLNGKPIPPDDQPIDPNDPDDPIIEDPPEPTDPEDPIPEPVRSSSYYDPNNLQNYVRIRAPGRNELY